MIKSIQLNPNICRDYGLRPVHLQDLGDIVAIAGPNGSGKTRLLHLLTDQWRRLEGTADEILILSSAGMLRRSVVNDVTQDAAREHAAAALLHYFVAPLGDESAPQIVIPGASRKDLAEKKAAFEQIIGSVRLGGHAEQVLRSGAWPKLVRIVNDPRQSEGEYRNVGEPVRNLQEPGLRRLYAAAQHQYMSHHSLWKAQHEKEIAAAESFFRTVFELLGVQCGWAISHTQSQEHIVATFNGRMAAETELSEGQRVVLRWCELIHDQVTDLSQAIILLDEPELHLHPDLLRRTIARLRGLEPSQLWITTHSLPLLADLGVRNLYEMRDGHISWAGNRTLDVQQSLLGPEGADSLRTFLADAATVAFHQFAAECLLQPGVVPLRGTDPQAAQFTNHLSRLLAATTEAHVLDYAAGSGRLIDAVASLPPEARTHLRYHAFCDPDFTTPDQRDACRAQLARLHPDTPDAPDAFFHTDLRDRQRTDATKMHAVLLCNVLHEVPPGQWPSLMSALDRCLRRDGWLLILEDQQMSIGELPHDKGYLVLDRIELSELFGVTDPERDRLGFTFDGRLSLAQVPADVLARCDETRVRRTLGQLRDRALQAIDRLRRTPADPAADHRRGRAHAYYAMLHTNATLALERPG